MTRNADIAAPSRSAVQQEAEERVLCAALMDRTVVDRVPLDPEDFSDGRRRLVWAAMRSAVHEGRPLDFVELSSILEADGTLRAAGGLEYLRALQEASFTAVGVEHHADRVRRGAAVRRAADFAEAAAEVVRETTAENSDGVWDRLASALTVASRGQHTSRAPTLAGALLGWVDELRARQEGKAVRAGWSTGIAALDSVLVGLAAPRLYVLGARPGTGKTALGVNIALNVAKQGVGVVYVTTEVSARDVALRVLTAVGRCDSRDVRTRGLTADEFSRVLQGVSDLKAAPKHFVIPDVARTLDAIARECREYASVPSRPPMGLLVVDHLHQLRAPDPRAQKVDQLADLTTGLLETGKRFGVPVLLLAQLNRGVTQRTGEGESKPRVSDLRGSGAIEENANVIMLLHDPQAEDPSAPAVRDVEVLIKKNREGEPGAVTLSFNRSFQTFTGKSGYGA